MRRLLLILLIVIAPLRSMAGDMMALGMATQQFAAATLTQAASVQVATDVRSAGGKFKGPHSDCMAQLLVQGAGADPAREQPDGRGDPQCQTCSLCQACSSSVLAPHPGIAGVLLLLAHDVPAVVGLSFSSADAARGFKPPIS